MFDDTIAAIATPLGEGGLAVIRLSGPQALFVADKSFVPAGKHSLKPSAAPTHTVQYGRIMRQGRAVDEVLLLVMRAPRTFTREDVAEITCHGGILAAKLVLDTVLENGARLAEPGEFTKRAFLNGRLDLAQAEAVADLIHARTELSLAAANEQLAGKLSQRINQLRDDMMKTLAHLEAHIDFPDEDISPDTRDQLLARLERGVQFMDDLLRTANEGQILRRGIRAAIIGRPNVGKSSLLNQLLGHDRAIVSPIAGTTRDTIEETANIRGLPVVFVDTAGLRQPGDSIEQEGIRRSRETVAQAELIVHVLDVSEPFTREDENYLTQFAHKKRIIVRNKIDLPPKLLLPPGLSGALAAKKGCVGVAGTETAKARLPVLPLPDAPLAHPMGEGSGVRAGESGERAGPSSAVAPLSILSILRSSATAEDGRSSTATEDGRRMEVREAQPSNLIATAQARAISPPLQGNPSTGAPVLTTPVVDVSALSGQGIDALKDAIKDMVWAGEVKAEMLQVMINSRHQDALRRAREATVRTVEALRNDLTLELVALDLRIAVNAVGEVVGKTTTEDLLDSIFSQFCLGK